VTQQDTDFEDEGPAKRFHVELFIVHPTLDPAEISTALGLEAHFAQRVGDPRKTPKGRPLISEGAIGRPSLDIALRFPGLSLSASASIPASLAEAAGRAGMDIDISMYRTEGA